MKVCIIGSGIAGLYSAYLLKKNGHNVTVFEKNKVIGGRIKTVQFDTIKVVAGAGVGREESDILLKQLCDDLHVKTTSFPSKPYYVGIKPEFTPLQIINELKHVVTEDDRRNKTFKQFASKQLGKSEYNKFVSYVGETDYEQADCIDVLYDYGFDKTFSSGFPAFGIDWDDFLAKFQTVLQGNIVTGTTVKKIKLNNKTTNTNTFTVDGEHFDTVILATPIKATTKLLSSILSSSELSLYDNIACQSFARVYVKLDTPLDLQGNRSAITTFPFQKIIEMNRERCVYMISYTDNQGADFWEEHQDTMDAIIEKQLKNLFKRKHTVLKSKLIYWDCGTHYYKPLDERFTDRIDYLNYIQNPLPNLYVVGEAVSRNQGWCEGALESVHAILNKNRRSRKRSKRSRRKGPRDGLSPKKILKAAGGILLAGAVLPASLPSTPVQSIPLLSPITPVATFSVPTPSMMKNLKNNSLEFLRLYRRLDNTRKEIKSRINTPPEGYTKIEKEKDNMLLNSIDELFEHHKTTLALQQTPSSLSSNESSCCIS
jgi:hypothetical protein